jgi:hypothetical protein
VKQTFYSMITLHLSKGESWKTIGERYRINPRRLASQYKDADMRYSRMLERERGNHSQT